MKCEKCGNIVEDNYIWCPVCGTKNKKKFEKTKEESQENNTSSKNKKVLIIILLLFLAVIITLFKEYKDGYEMCTKYNYTYPVNCSYNTTFAEYSKEFNIIDAFTTRYLDFSSLLFSPYIYIAVIISFFLIIISPKQIEKNTKYNLNKNYKIKLRIGLIPFALIILHGIIKCYTGVTFFFSTNYGLEALILTIILDLFLFAPINILALALIIKGLKDKHKSKQSDKNKQN